MTFRNFHVALRAALLVSFLLLSGGAAGAATVQLAWDRNPEPDVTGYLVLYGTESGRYTSSKDAGNQLSCDIDGLTDGQTYYFVVKAYSAGGGLSDPSPEVVGLAVGNLVVTMPSPARITSPSPAVPLGTAAQFTWDTGTSVSGYWLNIGTTRGGYELYSGYKGTSHAADISGLPVTGGPVWVRLYSQTPVGWLFSDHEYTSVTPGPGVVTSPAAGELVSANSVEIAWTAGVAVDAFWLDVGTSQGGYDVYSGYKGLSRASIVTLPRGATRIWVRLRSLIGGQWRATETSFLRPAPAPARVTSPAAGSTLPGASVTFSWDAGVEVDGYWVNIGRQQGGYELYSNYLGASRSMTVASLPIDGGPVWVRLMSSIGGSWQWVDHRFSAATVTPARITSPAVGGPLSSDPVTFSWSAGVGVDAYWLNVGTSQGGYDLYSGYMGQSRAASIAIPVIKGPIWVRLLSSIGGEWRFVDHAYASGGPVPAQMLTPAPSSTIPAGATVFTWSRGRGVQGYWLDVGTSAGSYDLSSGYRGSSLSAVVPDVPAGEVWVRIWSLIDGAWCFVDSRYQVR